MKRINNIHLENFEKILEKIIVIEYNETQIEIPGIIIFVKKSSSSNIINRLLNPSIEILTINEETFEYMLNSIKIYQVEGNKISIQSKTKPAKTIIFNMKNLESQIIFTKQENNILIVNDFLFTSKEADFHGETFFTSRKVFFLEKEVFDKIVKHINKIEKLQQ